MVRKYYPLLFPDGSPWQRAALALGRKTYELTEYLVDILGVEETDATWPGKAVYHDSCQISRVLGIQRQPRLLLARVRDLQLLEPRHGELCCGFGGAFSLQFPDVSASMIEEKTALIRDTGADYVISAELGCLMNMDGYIKKQHIPITPLHIAQILASRSA
jgi:L-lactate dehydrogenase complex protein LldE